MSPNYAAQSLLVIGLSFAAYYIGILIRKKVFPGRRSLPLKKQFLLGIPISLIVVPAMVPVIQKTLGDLSMLVTLGLIMEQGMILNETATRRLNALIAQNQGPNNADRDEE